ncbi:MAG TPA: prenyltransferase [Firmicutes bacterium]|nr:prenyltransferase [Bacillota bacterium]
MGLYFRAVRGPFVSASLLPVLYGTALARWYGFSISPLRLLLNVLGVVALHFGANAANDYYDYVFGADPARAVIKPFSGGSQLLQRGLLQPRHYSWLIGGHLALASVIALGFGFVAGPIAAILGLSGIFFGYYYSAPPVKLAYRGWGELAVGLAFGPLSVAGSFALYGGLPPKEVFAASLPLAFLIANVLYVNQYADYAEDKEADKLNLVVRLGPNRALPGVYALFAAAYAALIMALVGGYLPLSAAAGTLTLPLALWAARRTRQSLQQPDKLAAASLATIIVHAVTGAALIMTLTCFPR